LFELNSFEAAIQLASRGLGIAFLPKRNAARAVKDGRLKEIKITELRNTKIGLYKICATYQKGLQYNQVLASVTAELKEFI
jgi:DNA-binding transcriptional LysR family regulator